MNRFELRDKLWKTAPLEHDLGKVKNPYVTHYYVRSQAGHVAAAFLAGTFAANI
jgi:hypothetical protein